MESVVRPAPGIDAPAPAAALDRIEGPEPEERIAPAARAEVPMPAAAPSVVKPAPTFPLPPAAVARLAARDAAAAAQGEVRPRATPDAPPQREIMGAPERTAPEKATTARRPAAVRPAASRDRAASPAIRPQIEPVPPLPDVPARGAVGEAKPQPEAPTIRVSIGRIELRSTPPAPAPSGPPRRRPALTLEEYMQQRSGHR